jgi:hypothetical protein
MNPFVPLWISCRIRFLIFRFEDTDNLSVWIPGKVAPRTALGDHTGMHLEMDSSPNAVHDDVEFSPSHHPLGLCQIFARDRPDALRRLKDGMVNLIAFLLASMVLALAALEARRNLVRPPLQSRVYSFEVDAGVAAHSLSEFGSRT